MGISPSKTPPLQPQFRFIEKIPKNFEKDIT